MPTDFHQQVFLSVHNLTHVGTRATRRMLTKRGLDGDAGDISRWCKECIPCQVSKVFKHTIPQLQEIPVPARRFPEVSLNTMGPLPPS